MRLLRESTEAGDGLPGQPTQVMGSESTGAACGMKPPQTPNRPVLSIRVGATWCHVETREGACLQRAHKACTPPHAYTCLFHGAVPETHLFTAGQQLVSHVFLGPASHLAR